MATKQLKGEPPTVCKQLPRLGPYTEPMTSVILTWNLRNSLKNAVASSIGVPLAPLRPLRRLSSCLLLRSAVRRNALISKDGDEGDPTS